MNTADRRLPSLNAIRSFEAAARHRSFTRAAEELHVTQGAISRMVAALEEEIGVKLFHRNGRQLELTTNGKDYYTQVGEALDRIDRATRSIKNDDAGRTLSIATLPTFAFRWLVPRLADFEKKYRGITADLTTANSFHDFNFNAVDVAICYGAGQWPGCVSTFLMAEEIGVFCSPSYLRSRGALQGPRDLLPLRRLQHTTRPAAWNAFLSEHGIKTNVDSDGPGFEHIFMLLEAAAAGMGLALVPRFLAQDDVAQGRLVQAIPQTMLSQDSYYLVHAKSHGAFRKVKLFKEWLAKQA
ncbi:transcriptional regulator GcvA [Terriglobus tenax]|uniref:transcriptional regulator GcvA n=1 Tax=Terriglobus tenax TaxID=1111115 RepID=UPI0021E03390|nr:transcriptional regulator GcvA [Terriglobus tenax]